MLKTFDIKLDIEKDLYSPMQILFNVSNSDVESVQLNFEIVQDENPFDLTGKTIQLAVQSPSRKVIYVGIEIMAPLEGKASARLSQGAYLEEGIHVSEVYITDVDQTIVTSPFYFNSWQSITAQETVPTDPATGDVYWQNVLNKPLTFPPSTHSHPISEVVGLQSALDGKANVGETGGGGGTPDAHTHAIADVTGLQTALDGKADDVHTHTIANVTGLQTALDGKSDDAHSHTFAEITGKPLTYPPDAHSHTFDSITGKPATYPPSTHSHAVADVTGLQTALDGKMDDGSAYLKTETYSKAETYNKTEIDQMTMGEGGGSPVIVEDNLASTSTTNALSSNQGRILNETKADEIHTHAIADVTGLSGALDGKADDLHSHTSADITDFGTAVAGAIPLEYLTQTEGDGRYQAINTVPAHDHPEYLTPTEADALYQPINTVPTHDHPEYLTETEADALFLTPAEGDTRYQASGTVPTHTHTKAEITDFAHTHAIADVTNLQSTLDGKQPKPITTTALPTSVPTHAGQMAVDTTNKNTYIAEGTTANDWKKLVDSYDLSLKADTGHTHTKANITDFAHTHVKADITDFAHTHDWTTDVTGKPATFTPPLASSTVVGGHRVGNGLTMAGEYLTVREGAGINVSDTNYTVEIDRPTTDGWYTRNATGQSTIIWRGTQTAYDEITSKDPNTLYFITG